MKTATYNLDSYGKEKITVEYDENAPCRMCLLPVVEASMGGTDLCPWCDTGHYRNGEHFEFRDLADIERLRRKAKERKEKYI